LALLVLVAPEHTLSEAGNPFNRQMRAIPRGLSKLLLGRAAGDSQAE
jgi:hypothetical protein